jgi:serine/threonine protein phosphatase 1
MTESSPRRIIVGDVHGHYDGLMLLLDAIQLEPSDQLYFLGDLIDRGPQSAQVVEFVRHNDYPCLRGNHEQMMMEAFPNDELCQPALQNWLHSGGRSTIASYAEPPLMMEHLAWMRQLPSYLDLGDLWLVHAGVHPDMDIELQDHQQFCWIRDEFHSSPQPFFPDKLIITGHTITFTFPGVLPGAVVQGNGWMDIDTGAYHPRSGWLTAYDATHQLVYQVQVYERLARVLPLPEVLIRLDQTTRSHRQPLLL